MKYTSKKQTYDSPTKGKATYQNYSPKKGIVSNIRVLRTNLVYAIGLWSDICSEETLFDENYFGKYGKVEKIAINKKGNYDKKGMRNPSYSAVITYQDELSASLAVISLFQFKTGNGIIRCCYGCTKYCDNFFNGKICNKPSCPYMHQYDKQRQINLTNEEKDQDYDFDKHFNMASDIVFDSMHRITEIFGKTKLDNGIFPNPYQSMKILIQNQYISLQQYEQKWIQQNKQVLEQQQRLAFSEDQKQNSNSSCDSIQNQYQIMQLDIEQRICNRIINKIHQKNKPKSNLFFVQNKPTSPRFIEQFRLFFNKREEGKQN